MSSSVGNEERGSELAGIGVQSRCGENRVSNLQVLFVLLAALFVFAP